MSNPKTAPSRLNQCRRTVGYTSAMPMITWTAICQYPRKWYRTKSTIRSHRPQSKKLSNTICLR